MKLTSRSSEIIDELLDCWEDARESGRYVTPAEICQQHPHLTRTIVEYVSALEWVKSKEQDFFNFDGTSPGGFTKRKLGRFKLNEILGAGGFGTVWKGFDPVLEREVAIKVPRAQLFSSKSVMMSFLNEARRLAQLQHPNIVAVHDIRKDNDQVYIVSQFIEGPNLGELRQSRDLSSIESIRIINDVANALEFAHKHDVIHRDVKPANILIDKFGKAFLGDFGIAVSGLDAGTADGSGTIPYMSPEQMANKSETDTRSDQFSLAVVAHELLTGQLPFVPGTQSKYQGTSVAKITSFNPLIPVNAAKAISIALSSDPRYRFNTITEFKAMLNQVGFVRRRKSRSKVSAGLVVLFLLSVACLVALVLYVNNRSKITSVEETDSSEAGTETVDDSPVDEGNQNTTTDEVADNKANTDSKSTGNHNARNDGGEKVDDEAKPTGQSLAAR